MHNRCDNCKEILDCNYCYVCDGEESKRDQIYYTEKDIQDWIALNVEDDGREGGYE